MASNNDADTRFNKFGKISFTSTTRVNNFIAKLEQGKISGTRCVDCGLAFFPPRSDCYQCLSNKIEWFDVKGTGELLTYSRLHYAPVGFEEDLPYTIAVVDFGEHKIFGRISSDIAEENIKVGMKMRVVVNELPNGQLNYIFQKA